MLGVSRALLFASRAWRGRRTGRQHNTDRWLHRPPTTAVSTQALMSPGAARH